MALDAGNVKVYCRGVDLSTVLQSTSIEQTRDEVDATAYADPIRKMLPTLGKLTLAHAGLYVDGANTFGELLRQVRDADDEPITVLPEGATAGNKAFILLAHKASITAPEAAAPGAVHKASLRAGSRSALGDGVVGYVGTVSGDSQTIAFQLGALAAGQRVLATVHILSVTPTPAATFFLESDNGSGFASPAIQATSVSQTALGSTLLQVAGAVADDWWRVRWDHSGTGNFTVAIALAVVNSL